MTLYELYETIDLKALITQAYLNFGDKTSLSEAELISFDKILKSKIWYWNDCLLSCSEEIARKSITNFINRNVASIVWECRAIIKGINNDIISATHNQTKFTPINNEEDINEQPVFTDNVGYVDINNYMTKANFLKDTSILSLWETANEEIVRNWL